MFTSKCMKVVDLLVALLFGLLDYRTSSAFIRIRLPLLTRRRRVFQINDIVVLNILRLCFIRLKLIWQVLAIRIDSHRLIKRVGLFLSSSTHSLSIGFSIFILQVLELRGLS